MSKRDPKWTEIADILDSQVRTILGQGGPMKLRREFLVALQLVIDGAGDRLGAYFRQEPPKFWIEN
jgi:hypothetical protein